MSCARSRSRNGSRRRSSSSSPTSSPARRMRVRVDPLLDRSHTARLQPRRSFVAERLVHDIGQGFTSPESERRAQAVCRLGRPAVREQIAASRRELFEASRSSSSWVDAQHVAARTASQPIRSDEFSKAREIGIKGVRDRRGRALSPERLDQPVPGYRRRPGQKQHGQQGALLRTSNREPPAAVMRLDWAQDLEFHRAS